MPNLKIFRFNSINFNFYIAYYVIFSGSNACITVTCIIVPFVDVFSYECYEYERNREWRDREKISFGLSTVPGFFVTLEFVTPILPIKFSRPIDSLCSKFLHSSMYLSLFYILDGSFSMFKNVLSDKRMSLNEDNLEKLVVHCFRKNKNVT